MNPKAKKWTLGQSNAWNEIREHQKLVLGHPTIWMHTASYGEFEQGLPIIEAIKEAYPNYKIWVTFFSPSGYEHRKNEPLVDVVTYLPFDSKKNAALFIELVNPKLVVFVKYEFWFYYLNEAKNKNIPVILASAIFRSNQIFFKWYGNFYKNMLSLFTSILVQNKTSYELLMHNIQHQNIAITGDTRFDRVIKTVSQTNHISWINLLSNHKKIIAGSTWTADEIILNKTTAHFNEFNWIIVPHHVDPKSIQSTLNIFPNAITLTQLLDSGIQHPKPIVLIVDKIGLLRTLYQYSYISYIGGGFGKDGVHNVLEPAAFGKPVIWGANDLKYSEAIGLRNHKGGYSIHNEADLIMHISNLLQSSDTYNQICQNAHNYIIENEGATKKTMSEIVKYLSVS